jgi:hypothetical protein
MGYRESRSVNHPHHGCEVGAVPNPLSARPPPRALAPASDPTAKLRHWSCWPMRASASRGPAAVDVAHMRWNLVISDGEPAAGQFLAECRTGAGGAGGHDPWWDVAPSSTCSATTPDGRCGARP